MLREDRVSVVPGSPLECAYQELSRLDKLIIDRQMKYMGHGVVRFRQLAEEIEFFERCDAHLAPIVLAAEDAAMESRNTATPRTPWRWLPWVPWSRRRSRQ